MSNICLDSCRSCCKFRKEDLYIRPKITVEEIARLKSAGHYRDVFQEFNGSKNVFQISLVEKNKDTFICPYLDEKSHQCSIYAIRPFDCEFWPFVLMYDRRKEKVLIAHFNKSVCPITEAMSKATFDDYVKNGLEESKKQRILSLVKKYPELVWDYEEDTFVVCEIGSA